MLNRIVFWLKYIKWIYIGLLVMFFVILPLLCIYIYPGGLNQYEAYDQYVDFVYIFFPFFCVFPSILIHSEYIEGKHRELFYGEHYDLVLSVTLTVLVIVPFFLLYIMFPDYLADVADLLTQIAFIAFFMNGVVLFVDYLFYNTSITILFVLIYLVLANSAKIFEIFYEGLDPYFITSLQKGGIDSPYASGFLGVGFLGWIIGVVRSYYRKVL